MSDLLLLLLILVLFRGEGFGAGDFSKLIMGRFMQEARGLEGLMTHFMQQGPGPVSDTKGLLEKLQEMTAGMDPKEVEHIKNAALSALGKDPEGSMQDHISPQGRQEMTRQAPADGLSARLGLLEALGPLLSPRQAHMVREVAGGMRTLREMETGAAEWKL